VKARNGPTHEPVRTAEGIAPSNGRVERTESLGDGMVVGAPRRWLGLEGATLFVGALVGYSASHQAWWLVPITILLPDLSMLGYLRGTRVGARVYNIAHSTPLPAAVVAIGWWQEKSVVTALGLVWLAHIGLDRLIGYGLKYDDHFQHTHLGRLGRRG
jgi:hypothetical protein